MRRLAGLPAAIILLAVACLAADGIAVRHLRHMNVRAIAAIGLGLSLQLCALGAAHAAECPGNPYALGTSRVLTIDPAQYPRLGTVQYPETLPLEDKEVVLTFDDGPLPPYAEQAYADALLYLRRPREARAAYERVLAVTPKDIAARYGLFYAATELEDYTTAYATIDALVDDEPVWRTYKDDPTRYDNADRQYAEVTAAQARFYGNQLGEAWARITRIADAAPADGNARMAQYQIANARGWPQRARIEAGIAASLAPACSSSPKASAREVLNNCNTRPISPAISTSARCAPGKARSTPSSTSRASAIPIASKAELIVLAEYMPPHDPDPGIAFCSIALKSSWLIRPMVNSPTASNTETIFKSRPLCEPGLIVPP